MSSTLASEEYLRDRNRLLVEIANDFHVKLGTLSYDMGCSLMDMVEGRLLHVLNGYAYEGKVRWGGLGKGYVFEED